mgnify:CR=1 FL=1|tara:strand:- start:2045 stop:2419 length:375 start_codon:yes stop_codon:yes gene_type:complete
MYIDIDRVHRKIVSDEMLFGKDKFVLGVDTSLDALTMYRVKSDNSLSPAFWRELYHVVTRGGDMTIAEFIQWALEGFTERIVNSYLDNDELDREPIDKDERDHIAEALVKAFWDWNEKKIKLGQ